MVFFMVFTNALVDWVPASCSMHVKNVVEDGSVPAYFAASSTVDDSGLIVRSPDALHLFTLCNCDCKIITTAICFGPHKHSTRCIHPAQRCLNQTNAGQHLRGGNDRPDTSCMRNTKFLYSLDPFRLCVYLCQSLLDFHVLAKAELPVLIRQFLRTIYSNCMTEVEFAGKARGQFLMARGVRQGCPASGFLFATAFDPIFRWLHDSIIPRNPAAPDFLQPSPFACADDFAVVPTSCRLLMTALSQAFEVVDRVAGLSLTHRKCCWVQCGNDSCHELLEWVSTNCEEFREMKMVERAKCVHHDWTRGSSSSMDCTTGNFTQRAGKINETSKKSPVERLIDFKLLCLISAWVHWIQIRT